jgi:hypothetical protein
MSQSAAPQNARTSCGVAEMRALIRKSSYENGHFQLEMLCGKRVTLYTAIMAPPRAGHDYFKPDAEVIAEMELLDSATPRAQCD